MVCTGNICRSPMAEALLRHRLAALDVPARVHSAGLLGGGVRAADHGVAALAGRGLDIRGHRSRRLAVDHLEGADLVLGMARVHVREAALTSPAAWPRAFTLKEVVRRAVVLGARAPGQRFDEWLGKLHAGRSRDELLGASADDDVADPVGLGADDFERTADELDDLVRRLVALGWSTAGPEEE